jgi:hypothetical protein
VSLQAARNGAAEIDVSSQVPALHLLDFFEEGV